MPGRGLRSPIRRIGRRSSFASLTSSALRMASYFLNRSSNALRASLGRMEVKPPDTGAGETLTAVGAVSFSMVVRKA